MNRIVKIQAMDREISTFDGNLMFKVVYKQGQGLSASYVGAPDEIAAFNIATKLLMENGEWNARKIK